MCSEYRRRDERIETQSVRLPLQNLFRLPRAAAELARLTRQQWLPPERLRALQWRRLRSIVRYSEERCSFYASRFRAAGFSSRDLRTWSDFSQIPVTTRKDLQDSVQLLADGYDLGAMHRSRTSGSMGVPTATYFDPWARILARHVLKLRARLACGLRPWDRVAIFQEDTPGGSWAALGRRASFSVHRPPSEVVDDLRAFAPTALYGPPSHLSRLAQEGAKLPRLRLVFTSAEMLDGSTRQQLEQAFGAPVLDVYGCTETKEIAWQCPEAGGYHVNAEWLVVEVSDGMDASGPEKGAILVTSLYNLGMPLLRYQVGDTGTALEGCCPCGRGLPLMIPVLGRAVDYVRLPDGSRVSPYSLTCAVETVPGMRQYQIVQETRGGVTVRVVPGDEFGEAGRKAIQDLLGPILPGAALNVEVVREIPREPSGKFRVVRSDVFDETP